MKYVVLVMAFVLLSCSDKKEEYNIPTNIQEESDKEEIVNISENTEEAKELETKYPDFYNGYLGFGSEVSGIQVEEYENNRVELNKMILGDDFGFDVRKRIDAAFGEPIKVESKEVENTYNTEQIDIITTIDYNGIRYILRSLQMGKGQTYILSIVLYAKTQRDFLNNVMSMNREQIENMFGKVVYSEEEYLFLSSLNPDTAGSDGIKAYFENDKITKIVYFPYFE